LHRGPAFRAVKYREHCKKGKNKEGFDGQSTAKSSHGDQAHPRPGVRGKQEDRTSQSYSHNIANAGETETVVRRKRTNSKEKETAARTGNRWPSKGVPKGGNHYGPEAKEQVHENKKRKKKPKIRKKIYKPEGHYISTTR